MLFLVFVSFRRAKKFESFSWMAPRHEEKKTTTQKKQRNNNENLYDITYWQPHSTVNLLRGGKDWADYKSANA